MPDAPFQRAFDESPLPFPGGSPRPKIGLRSAERGRYCSRCSPLLGVQVQRSFPKSPAHAENWILPLGNSVVSKQKTKTNKQKTKQKQKKNNNNQPHHNKHH